MEKQIYVLIIPRENQRLVVYSLIEIWDSMMEEINQLHNSEKKYYLRRIYNQKQLMQRSHEIYCKMCKDNWNEKKFYITSDILNSDDTCHYVKILEGEW